MDNAASVFARYEEIRHRLPDAEFPENTEEITSLVDIAASADAFVFDAYGVLNIGNTAIEGAARRLEQLRARGIAIRILSNAASYDHDSAVAKFRNLGFSISKEEIITSRVTTLGFLDNRTWGCIAAETDDLSGIPFATRRLAEDRSNYEDVDGFLFLSTECWTPERQEILEQSLVNSPRPLVIANADIIAPREDGFSLEPGHFGHLIADTGYDQVRFFGKPYSEAYELVEDTLPGIAPNRIVMCGDTLHTDILGAAARGWRTVLVTRDGLFSGTDALGFSKESKIVPNWHLPRI